MFAILSLGFLLGMQHALEADHIAAVSSIAARRSEVGDIVKHGLTWGLGHTLTLFAFAGAAILLGHAIPETLTRPLETAVGVMLVGLGAHVLWRMWRDRVHFHKHRHGDGRESQFRLETIHRLFSNLSPMPIYVALLLRRTMFENITNLLFKSVC